MARRTTGRACLVYKPFGVLCQFSPVPGKRTLADCGPLPPGVYPAGRLDEESEGLVLLTNSGVLQHRLTDPRHGHPRTYLVQVEGRPDLAALEALRTGVTLDRRLTQRAEVEILSLEPNLPPRPVPIRYRKTIPTTWVRITLREGRNRQVRRMTAAVGYPTLRLVRVAIGSLTIDGLEPGQWRFLSEDELNSLPGAIPARPGDSKTPAPFRVMLGRRS